MCLSGRDIMVIMLYFGTTHNGCPLLKAKKQWACGGQDAEAPILLCNTRR